MEAILTRPSSHTKANMSLKLELEEKDFLKQQAKKQDRSVHYLMTHAVRKYIAELKEDDEHKKYIEQRVMKAYNRLETEGSNGVDSEEMIDLVMSRVQARLANKK